MALLGRQFLANDLSGSVNFLFRVEDMHREPDAVKAEFLMSWSDDDLVFVEKHLDERLSREFIRKK